MANYYILITTYDSFVGYHTETVYADSAYDAFVKYRWYAQFECNRGRHYCKVSKPYPDPDKYVVRVKPHVYHNSNKPRDIYDDLPF